eukprot:GHVT01070350.1.p1 GENE.GHVT01070350.1~~GHVT01070350.1.p1  ORF type:complete len:228 (+),score=32.60 GHVT01070350.1:348-1031(+)
MPLRVSIMSSIVSYVDRVDCLAGEHLGRRTGRASLLAERPLGQRGSCASPCEFWARCCRERELEVGMDGWLLVAPPACAARLRGGPCRAWAVGLRPRPKLLPSIFPASVVATAARVESKGKEALDRGPPPPLAPRRRRLVRRVWMHHWRSSASAAQAAPLSSPPSLPRPRGRGQAAPWRLAPEGLDRKFSARTTGRAGSSTNLHELPTHLSVCYAALTANRSGAPPF